MDNGKMEFTIEQLKDVVKYCGGYIDLVEKYIEKIKNTQINNLTELQAYPFKSHYSYIVDYEKYPHLYQWFSDVHYNECEQIFLSSLLEDIGDLIDTSDEDDELTYAELVDKYYPEIAKELIDLKFGSMEYDW